jgi:hypothetical protein
LDFVPQRHQHETQMPDPVVNELAMRVDLTIGLST